MNKKSSKNQSNYKVLLLVVSFVAMISTFGFIYYYQQYTGTYNELNMIKTGYTTKLWQPGEIVETPDFTITINSSDIDTVGIPQYLPAPEGMEFLTIDMTVANKTNQDQLFLPVNSTYLKDQDNNVYGLTATPNVEQGVAGTVPAGDSKTGQIGFMIPQNTQALRFYFEPYGDNGGNTIVIDLNSLLWYN